MTEMEIDNIYIMFKDDFESAMKLCGDCQEDRSRMIDRFLGLRP